MDDMDVVLAVGVGVFCLISDDISFCCASDNKRTGEIALLLLD